MALSIAHLGPAGTNTEVAALTCAHWLAQMMGERPILCPYPSIPQSLRATAQGETQLAVVPVENLIEGSVTSTLDTLWQLGELQIQWGVVLPIANALLSKARELSQIRIVYSHPQAIAQCQDWLAKNVPLAQAIPVNATTEAIAHLDEGGEIGVIASERAAQLYQVPVLVSGISDNPDNCTRFWVVRKLPSSLQLPPQALPNSHMSLAFSVPEKGPGALVRPLQVFADQGINLTRIESRPSKRSLGEYVFFIDLETDADHPLAQDAIAQLKRHTETLKIFGSYPVYTYTEIPLEVLLNDDN